MISSIQTDEARHSQQGGPTLEILVEHDPRRAQWIIDKTFWVSARLFSILTGPGMDYYTPLPMRKQSYKEFMQEWIGGQFLDQLRDYGLKKPWYWDEFIAGLDTWHHSQHLGVWYWRPTVWWNPQGGRVTRGARLAARQVPALGRAVRARLGCDHRQHQRRPGRPDPAGDAAVAVQPVPPARRHRGFAAQPSGTRCAVTRSGTTAARTTSARGHAGRSGGRTGTPCTTRR